ncbi:MAG TPA: shikimate kinase [Thermoplasmata archaeon]|nr:shikimate kinase [Thermoplasmata archaeon]
MKARASCFGAGTIVNAIAAGRGMAFGLALRVSATAEARPNADGVRVRVPAGVDPTLAQNTASRVLRRSRRKSGLEVSLESEIPISRGLKSSSAVANAVVLASARALSLDLEPLQMIEIGVDAALDAGVTITGAFDDACASFFGGIVGADNRARKIIMSDRFPEGLVAAVHVPRRAITKQSLKRTDFSPIRPTVEEAFQLALKGDYFRALEMNSSAYASVLDIDETPAIRARAAGAVASGISGAGPSIVALVKPARADAVVKAMDDGEAEVLIVSLNTIESREVVR